MILGLIWCGVAHQGLPYLRKASTQSKKLQEAEATRVISCKKLEEAEVLRICKDMPPRHHAAVVPYVNMAAGHPALVFPYSRAE